MGSILAFIVQILSGIAAVLKILESFGIKLKKEERMSAGPLSKSKKWVLVWAATFLLISMGSAAYGFYLVAHRPQPSSTGVHIAWQKPIASADPRFPFGLEVGVEPEEDYNEPAQVFIVCNGDIGDAHGIRLLNGGDLQAVNEAVMGLSPNSWYHPEIFNIKWRSPLWKSGDPLIVRFFSRTRIKAEYAVPIIFRPNP